ncbi:MAG: PASTA domain-containing protein [Actinomycetota bacterium]|nr:PASTA domain-containing protein [Actinomycetota bacterium]
MEGTVFNQRYLLKGKIGVGERSEVYLADDLQQPRLLAVKVFHSQYSSDPSFVQRFPLEAQTTSSLNHPNIIDVFDWGNEYGLYYMVMEYVDGSNLKELLAVEGKALPGRAAEIAMDVCSALDFAHRHNLVHGDIKPSNILISKTGQVKVTDFGIARAGSGGTAAQYISPEQAQGLAVDGRTDIYSLGIVLYEMLIGRPPFDDADPTTVAYKQVREEPVPPTALNPEIPPVLEAVVLKTMAKNPAERFQTAQQMKDELMRFLGKIPAAPAPVTMAAPVAEAKKSSAAAWAWAGVIVTILVVAGIVLAVVFTRDGGETVQVTNVVNMKLEDASIALEQQGLKVGDIEDQYMESESQEADVVVAQDPAAGSEVKTGNKIKLTVIKELRMPNVTGLSKSDAVNNLKKQNLTVVEIDNKPVEEEEEIGKVVSQSPAGGSLVSPDVTVKLEVGVEPTTVTVPNVVGMEEDKAKKELEDSGLDVQVEEDVSPDVPEGQVMSQDPTSGQTLEKGGTVTMVVSKGPS